MCMLSKQSKTMNSMKRTIFTLLAAVTMTVGASAQETERIDREDILSLYGNAEKTDSLYNFWNTYVQVHPKDEVAWRNLFEVSEKKVFRWVSTTKDWKGGEAFRKQLNVVGRMEKAIPRTYTFYYSAYEGSYLPEEEELAKKNNMTTLYMHHEAYADSAIVLLPKDAPAGDYELWTQYLIPKRDTVRMANVLTQYYESGQYPEESLQYHFNELQGMEEGGVYIAPHPGEMVGKLILQHVLGVHKDKILYDEDAAMFPEYVKDVFGHIGIPFNDDVWNQLWTTWQDKTLTAIMRYIFDHSKRPVYLSAHDMWQYIIGEGLPDELKVCLYNEGLTMRYSTKPYDNRAVKRRNIEQRYRLEYLRMRFHPVMKNTQRFSGSAEGDAYAMNYMRLLRDQLPYYKQHNKERYQWLSDIFTDIIDRLEKENYDVDEFKGYLK